MKYEPRLKKQHWAHNTTQHPWQETLK